MSRQLPMTLPSDAQSHRRDHPLPQTMLPQLPGASSGLPAVNNAAPDVPTNEPAASSSPIRDESRKAYRIKSIEAIVEAKGDVQAFLEELEQKRRQLDEQIQRYIKQKDREYKFFERDLRVRYRNAKQSGSATPLQPQQHSNNIQSDVVQFKQNPNHEQGHGKDSVRSPSRSGATHNGLRNGSASERESEVLGLFTPSFLPLLDDKVQNADTERSPSAPPALALTEPSQSPDRAALRRAHSDSAPRSAIKSRSGRLGLEHRTSSSGSETGKNLISALKPQGGRPKHATRKRVSLIVGDDIVAPSDNVQIASILENEPEPTSSAQSHTVVTIEDSSDLTQSSRVDERESIGRSDVQRAASPTIEIADNVTVESKNPVKITRVADGPIAPAANTATEASIEDDELGSPFAMDEEIKPLTSERYLDDDAEGDIELPSPAISPETIAAETAPLARTISTPKREPQFQTSRSASSQPVSPGFSRPKVQADPQSLFDDDVKTPEIEDNPTFGSFSSSRSPYMQTSGSLGESFMQRNAEDMGRRRRTSQTKS